MNATLALPRTRPGIFLVLAFLMSVIARSLPELIILRKVLKVRLIFTFVAVVASEILAVGFIFNAVL